MVKNPAANVADMGSVLGLGRSHVLMEQLSPRATTQRVDMLQQKILEPQL